MSLEIKAPANVFNLLPAIYDIHKYDYPGAQFKGYDYMDQFTILIGFELALDAYDNEMRINIIQDNITIENLQDLDLSSVGINKTLEEITAYKETLDSTQFDYIQSLVDNLRNVKEKINTPLTDEEKEELVCPDDEKDETETTTEDNTYTVILKDSQENVIKTIVTDLDANTQSCDANVGNAVRLNILNNIPPINFGNDIEPEENEENCYFPPDSQITEKLTEAKSKTKLVFTANENDLQSLDDNIKSIINAQEEKFKELDPDFGDKTEQDYIDQVNELINEGESKNIYGIPLLTINPEDNIIIQINQGQLEIFNFDTTFAEFNIKIDEKNRKRLFIDTLANPGAKILPGIKYYMVYTKNFNTHTLYLKKEFSNTIYSSTAVNNIKAGPFYLGMDKSGLKHFCGKIYTVNILENTVTSMSRLYERSYTLRPIYGALAFYDFYNKSETDTRIIYNKVYPFHNNNNKPISMSGNFTLKDRFNNYYTFMNNGIIDDIFCRSNLVNNSFSIGFWIRKNELTIHNQDWNSYRQILLSDNINNNYLYYDASNRQIVIEFGGIIERINYELLNYKWYLINLDYNKELKILTLNILTKEDITSSANKDTFTIEDIEFDFELISFYGEYSKEARRYINRSDLISGPIFIFGKSILESQLIGIINNHFPVLKYYSEQYNAES